MDRKTILIATCAVLTAIWGLQIARAQGASLAAGVYTEEQSKRGMELYKAQCASCHGDDLKGNEIIPALTGDTFTGNWKGKTVGDLIEKINMTMPALDPGSLTPEQTSDFRQLYSELTGVDLRRCPDCHVGTLRPEPVPRSAPGPP